MVGGRQRKPTARALDAAESRLLVASLSRERPRAVGGRPASPATPAPRASASTSTTKTTYSAAAAPVKKNGRAQNARGKQAIERETGIAQEQVDEEVADGTLEGSAGLGPYGGQQDLTLYCVCLGYDTGEQPMIQCEHCSNWFHFGCVGLTDQVASQIEAYSCDMCEQMGMGSSRSEFLVPLPPLLSTVPFCATPGSFPVCGSLRASARRGGRRRKPRRLLVPPLSLAETGRARAHAAAIARRRYATWATAAPPAIAPHCTSTHAPALPIARRAPVLTPPPLQKAVVLP